MFSGASTACDAILFFTREIVFLKKRKGFKIPALKIVDGLRTKQPAEGQRMEVRKNEIFTISKLLSHITFRLPFVQTPQFYGVAFANRRIAW